MLATNPMNLDYFDSEVVTEPSLPYIEIPTTPRNPFMFRDELWLLIPVTETQNH